MTILEHALAMLARGFRVFPLSPGTKIPLPKSNGYKDATADANTVRHWFATMPELNYGIALSATDLILDADPRNYPAGRDILGEFLAKHFPSGGMPSRLIVTTPSGGTHIYLTKPEAIKVRKKQAMWPGIDFLSEGAYVVGPGSLIDGVAYTEMAV